MTEAAEPRFASRGTDHIGVIARLIGDLQGIETVVHELVQNADDASDATEMRFTVTDQALEVWNDGTFAACDDIYSGVCAWIGERGHRCDFHSFRAISSGDKRGRADTTGAFGVGFNSVYQLTDRPCLISAGHRWEVDETQTEAERISGFDGPEGHGGTTFVLPWATEESAFRSLIRRPVVTPEQIRDATDRITSAVPASMPFLKRLEAISVCGPDGERRLKRARSGSRVTVTDDRGSCFGDWFVIEGSGEADIAELRRRFPHQIESTRRSTVQIAFPMADESTGGRLYASLPTEQRHGLPIHINADFYPASDRKRLLFDDGPESDFNRLCVETAAQAVAAHLSLLVDAIGDERFLDFLSAAEGESKRPNGQIDDCFSAFWGQALLHLPQARVVLDTTGSRVRPSEARLLVDGSDYWMAELLDDLGIRLVAPDVRARWYSLRRREIGLESLRLKDVLDRANESWIRTAHAESKDGPGGVGIRALWRVINSLLAQQPDAASVSALKAVRLLPTTTGDLSSIDKLLVAEPELGLCLARLGVPVEILAKAELGDLQELVGLCRPLEARQLIRSLAAAAERGTLDTTADSGPLLRYFDRSKADLTDDDKLRLARLALFPAGGCLRPLAELSLPGGFEDPIGVAELVDPDKVEGLEGLLRALGIRQLTLARFCTEVLPRALDADDLDDEARWRVTELLSDRLSSISDQLEVTRGLRALDLVPCRDGTWRRGSEVYLPTIHVDLVPDGVAIAADPRQRPEPFRKLLEWLGCQSKPRARDLIARCRELSAQRDRRRAVAAKVIALLGESYKKDRAGVQANYEELKQFPWLPADGEATRAFLPREVATAFRRSLFASQGRFVDVPLPVQQGASDFLSWLGLRSEPTVEEVAKHLLFSCQEGTRVSRDVWQFLDRNADHSGIEILRDTACIPLSAGRPVRAREVFWRDPEFGRWRHRLDPTLLEYRRIFDRLGVKDDPAASDAIDVLQEIAAQHGGEEGSLLAADVPVVRRCWDLLGAALAEESVTEADLLLLRTDEVVLDSHNVLRQPQSVLFGDPQILVNRFLGTPLLAKLIDRVEGVWPALAAAGVRGLESAIETTVVDHEPSVDPPLLWATLDSRRAQLERVLADQSDGVERIRRLLERVSLVGAADIAVQSAVTLDGAVYTSAVYSRTAHFDESGARFLVTIPDSITAEVAHELAVALGAEGPLLSHLAPVLGTIIDAETDEAAARELDWYGYRTTVEGMGTAGAESASVGLSIEEEASEAAEEPVATDDDGRQDETPESSSPSLIEKPGEAGASPPSNAPAATAGGAGAVAPAEERQSADSESDDSVRRSTPLVGEASERSRESRSTDPEERARLSRPPSAPAAQSRMVSYVAPRVGESREPSPNAASTRAEIERAAVAVVLDYERSHGRDPVEMPPMNKGYDIESTSPTGELRYIEVKGTSEIWGPHGVAISSSQYALGREKGEEFWLYVVESALTSPRLSVICDPVSQIDQYVFDGGWRAVHIVEDAARPPFASPLFVPAGAAAALPFFEAGRLDVGVGTPDGWVRFPDKALPTSGYSVRVAGYSMGLAYYGGAAIIDSERNTAEDGDLVLVQLSGQSDPDTASNIAVRYWAPERDVDGTELALRLQSDGSVEPLTVEDPEEVRILGHVVELVRPEDLHGN